MNSFVFFPHMKTSCFTLHQQTKFYYWSTNDVCFCFGQLHPQSGRRPPLSDYVGCCSTFCLSCKAARYSSDHRFQSRSQIYCACFHLRLAYWLFWSNTPRGRIGFLSIVRRWFGVKDTWVLGYLGDGIASASHKTVSNVSSVKVCRCKTDKTAPFQQVWPCFPKHHHDVRLMVGWNSTVWCYHAVKFSSLSNYSTLQLLF